MIAEVAPDQLDADVEALHFPVLSTSSPETNQRCGASPSQLRALAQPISNVLAACAQSHGISEVQSARRRRLWHVRERVV